MILIIPNQESNYCSSINPLTSTLVDKFNSCVRKSRIFSKPTSPSSPPMPPPIRYRKGELIGCGAFGHVYMGMNFGSGELIAIKQVSIAANGATREKAQAHIRELEEEVRLLQNLSHPNIVRYLGVVQEEETINILLEFVPGYKNLHQAIIAGVWSIYTAMELCTGTLRGQTFL
ncbi:hypothetical protein OIU78_021235 [Salix suchowensis]|nr:hypothetical protein OIU78_021235 [Salix suchowensis]